MSDQDHQSFLDPHLALAAKEGCQEAQLLLTRRSLLGLSAAFCASSFIPRSALAASSDKRFLLVILRGGMDGLHVAIPHANGTYQEQRTLFRNHILTNKVVLARNTTYWLNPSLPKLGALFDQGHAALVHAIAPPLRNRSHFQCQYNLESGLDEKNARVFDGWLNRALQKLEAAEMISLTQRKLALGVGPTPFVLAGRSKVLSWSMDGSNSQFPEASIGALQTYYSGRRPSYSAMLSSALATDAKARTTAEASGMSPFVPRDPTSQRVREMFRGAARLMSADDGPRIGVLSVDGWDTHMGEISGYFDIAYRLGQVDSGIDDFRIQMGSTWSNTVVVCVSEFGRTIELNSTNNAAGTEHGMGTVALLAGGALKGGKFFGEEPDLDAIVKEPIGPTSLTGRHDIPATTDTRQLFKSVLIDHLGMDSAVVEADVFPNSAGIKKLEGLFT